MTRNMKLILASSSPRRRELLGTLRLDFDVIASHVPEEHRAGERAEEYVARLSRDKAHAVATQHADRWVIAADTTVLLGDQLLEKPADRADAIRMVTAISGRTHMVYTAITLENHSSGYVDTRVAETEVRILPLSPADIEWYVNTGEPMDKAGAYGAQGAGGIFIESIRGSHTNVVGLPLALLFQMLVQAGLDPLR